MKISYRMEEIEKNQKPSEYPHVLQLYLKAPDGNCTLDEFEDFAFDRIKMLSILEKVRLMGHELYSQEWKTEVIEHLKRNKLEKWANLIQNNGDDSSQDIDIPMRREDHLSHFTLRLVHCCTAEERSWLIEREIELFRLRFSHLNGNGFNNFIKAYKLPYVPISQEAKDEIKEQLINSTYGINCIEDIQNTDFYEISFTEVPELVSKRKVFLKRGYALVPKNEFVSCIITKYRRMLERHLVRYNQRVPLLDDDRVKDLQRSIHIVHADKEFTYRNKYTEPVDIEDLGDLASTCFPLCMRSLYEHVKTKHHLKHFGRLQLGLFLKDIGLSLENAIKFWKDELTKTMDEELFNSKQYVYSIRHIYGDIGKRCNKPAYSCDRIISFEPGPGYFHGCPFVHWDLDILTKKLIEIGINSDGMKDVLDAARAGNCQMACSNYFIHTHGGHETKPIINHPNQYFKESRETRENKSKSENPSAKRCDRCSSDPCQSPSTSS